VIETNPCAESSSDVEDHAEPPEQNNLPPRHYTIPDRHDFRPCQPSSQLSYGLEVISTAAPGGPHLPFSAAASSDHARHSWIEPPASLPSVILQGSDLSLSPSSVAVATNISGHDLIPDDTPTPFVPLDPILNESQASQACSPREHTAEINDVFFLVRHFSTGPGRWMDMFDLGSCFSHYIPVMAMTNPILRHSAAAVAAKQLSRVQGDKIIVGRPCVKRTYMEAYLDSKQTDWTTKAEEHYNEAISLLSDALGEGCNRRSSFQHETDSTWQDLGDQHDIEELDDMAVSYNTGSGENSAASVTKGRYVDRSSTSDELTAAITILCAYEFFDVSGSGWSLHVAGTKSLLDIVANSMRLPQPAYTLARPWISTIRKATFWNFARQDFLSALINSTQTRLDPEDLLMWKHHGLLVDENGSIVPSNRTRTEFPACADIMKEDMIANALIWLMAKLINYLVAADTAHPNDNAPPWNGVNQVS